MLAESISSSYQEQETSLNIGLAVIGDTHVGKKGDPHAFSPEEFFNKCKGLAENPNVSIAIFTGDILDKTAEPYAIESVEAGLRLFAEQGKPVLYVWGNNEDQSKDATLRDRLENIHDQVHVLQNDTCVIDIPNGGKIAFVVASRIIPADRYKNEVLKKRNRVKQILTNRRIIKEQGDLDTFKRNLELTEPYPTIVIHHAAENVGVYKEYHDLAHHRKIRKSAEFTHALIWEQQRRQGVIGGPPIIGGFSSHAEWEDGGHTYTIKVPAFQDILFLNVCSSVTDKKFSGIDGEVV